jgi:hypothetical protein
MPNTSTSVVAAGLGAALTIVVFVVGIKLSVTPAWPADDPIPRNVTQNINRALKGDRFPLMPKRTGNLARPPMLELPVAAQKLLEGCEPVVSPIGASPLARVARICQS